MLAVEGREDQWCAACGAHDGSVELRVGEPPRRGLLRRRDEAGETWLREHGFTEEIDAWSVAATDESDAACAATLEAALVGALGADRATPLEHVLTHPGLLDGADAPPPDAAIQTHLAAAFRALVHTGRGHFSIGSGRPEALRAFVGAVDGDLVVEREVPGVQDSPGESWREPLTLDGAWRAATELARRVRAERPGTDAEPWFLAYIAPNS